MSKYATSVLVGMSTDIRVRFPALEVPMVSQRAATLRASLRIARAMARQGGEPISRSMTGVSVTTQRRAARSARLCEQIVAKKARHTLRVADRATARTNQQFIHASGGSDDEGTTSHSRAAAGANR